MPDLHKTFQPILYNVVKSTLHRNNGMLNLQLSVTQQLAEEAV